MAKATFDTVTSPVVTTTFQITTVVKLELSLEEADTLYGVLRNVAGCPISTPRKHSDNIREALLAGCGIDIYNRVKANIAFDSIGTIKF